MQGQTDAPIAVVTGAAAGLGKSIAMALANAGYRVYGTSRRGPEAMAGSPYAMLALDVRSDDSVRAVVAELTAAAGRLDVLVNNAGSRFLGAAEETSVDEAKAVFETNFFGTHRVITSMLPLM